MPLDLVVSFLVNDFACVLAVLDNLQLALSKLVMNLLHGLLQSSVDDLGSLLEVDDLALLGCVVPESDKDAVVLSRLVSVHHKVGEGAVEVVGLLNLLLEHHFERLDSLQVDLGLDLDKVPDGLAVSAGVTHLVGDSDHQP